MIKLTLLLTLVGFSLIQALSLETKGLGPATCQIYWRWPNQSCESIKGILLKQIDFWSKPWPCTANELCVYSYKGLIQNGIIAGHTQIRQDETQSLSFRFTEQNSNCSISVLIL